MSSRVLDASDLVQYHNGDSDSVGSARHREDRREDLLLAETHLDAPPGHQPAKEQPARASVP